MRIIVTEEMKNNMLYDYNNGYDLESLSKKYNIKEQTIQKHFKTMGIALTKGNAKRFSQKEIDDIIFDYKCGLRPIELSKKYNRTSGVIISKLKSLGIYVDSNYRFTDDDIKFLLYHYPKRNWMDITKRFPNIPKSSIHTKMSKLGVSLEDYFWNEDDISLLKKNYSSMYGNVKELIKLFNNKYTYKAIVSKARKLGLKSREFWNEYDKEILINNYSSYTLDEMMMLLPDRSRNSIISQAKKLNLQSKLRLETNFNKHEVDFIVNNYNAMTDKEIAIALNRTPTSIADYRSRNELLKIHNKSSYIDLSEYVRRNNSEWKKESMQNCNYKCVLTGKHFDDIHHIYGLNLILSETLELLNINIKENIEDYSEKELKSILETFRETQSKYPLGVCLTKRIHQQFHNTYGYGNNTKEQWDEFYLHYQENVA